MLEQALEMIGYRWPVVALHGVVHDNTGKAWCSCSKPADCRSPAKHPRTPHGLLNATLDAATARAWLAKWPGANIGIATGIKGNLVVLDIDPKHGGNESLENLQANHGKLPGTAEVATGGGGRHLYFKHPGGELRNSAGQLGPGLDVRGDGGYVVAPGSKHISGRTYDWRATPEMAGVAKMPDWLSRLCRKPVSMPTENRLPGRAPIVLTAAGGCMVVEGRRNEWLTRHAGWMRRHGMSELAIGNVLLAFNAQTCSPPLDPEEVMRIAKSVGRYAPV